MDLFIINRYNGDDVDENLIERETKHLQRLKEKIEERKKTHETQKVVDVITLKPQDTDKNKSYESPKKSGVIYRENNDNNELIEHRTLSQSEKTENDKGPEFKVLGLNDFEKKSKVQRVLPYWLSHPFSVTKSLQHLNCKVVDQHWLHNILKTTLLNEGVTHLFPVQEKVIPFILNQHKLSYPLWPHDICVSAPTGSGKTLAFVLPIIQVLLNQIGHYIRALIVLPVQELAIQVANVCKKYCSNTGLRVALLSGSTPLHQEQQNLMKYTESLGWVSEIDIIVCTAGRLVEHLQNTEGFSLKNLKFLVIDEADRIMDNIQNDWLYHMERHIKLDTQSITNKIPNLNWNSMNTQSAFPHKLLFSATLSPDPELLEQWGLFQPKLFSATSVSDLEGKNYFKMYATPDELKESYVTCNAEEKPLLLFHFLAEQKWDKVLCFTNSAQAAHRLTVLLNNWGKDRGLKVAELSSALDRSTREKVLKKFTQSEVNVILSTDALARGIDIPNCNYVVSYDPPRNIKTYVHRIGRTGRAGKIGNAVTILLHNQFNMFKELLQYRKNEMHKLEISEQSYSHLLQSYERAIQETRELIRNEIGNKIKKSIELKRSTKKKLGKRKHKGE